MSKPRKRLRRLQPRELQRDVVAGTPANPIEVASQSQFFGDAHDDDDRKGVDISRNDPLAMFAQFSGSSKLPAAPSRSPKKSLSTSKAKSQKAKKAPRSASILNFLPSASTDVGSSKPIAKTSKKRKIMNPFERAKLSADISRAKSSGFIPIKALKKRRVDRGSRKIESFFKPCPQVIPPGAPIKPNQLTLFGERVLLKGSGPPKPASGHNIPREAREITLKKAADNGESNGSTAGSSNVTSSSSSRNASGSRSSSSNREVTFKKPAAHNNNSSSSSSAVTSSSGSRISATSMSKKKRKRKRKVSALSSSSDGDDNFDGFDDKDLCGTTNDNIDDFGDTNLYGTSLCGTNTTSSSTSSRSSTSKIPSNHASRISGVSSRSARTFKSSAASTSTSSSAASLSTSEAGGAKLSRRRRRVRFSREDAEGVHPEDPFLFGDGADAANPEVPDDVENVGSFHASKTSPRATVPLSRKRRRKRLRPRSDSDSPAESENDAVSVLAGISNAASSSNITKPSRLPPSFKKRRSRSPLRRSQDESECNDDVIERSRRTSGNGEREEANSESGSDDSETDVETQEVERFANHSEALDLGDGEATALHSPNPSVDSQEASQFFPTGGAELSVQPDSELRLALSPLCRTLAPPHSELPAASEPSPNFELDDSASPSQPRSEQNALAKRRRCLPLPSASESLDLSPRPRSRAQLDSEIQSEPQSETYPILNVSERSQSESEYRDGSTHRRRTRKTANKRGGPQRRKRPSQAESDDHGGAHRGKRPSERCEASQGGLNLAKRAPRSSTVSPTTSPRLARKPTQNLISRTYGACRATSSQCRNADDFDSPGRGHLSEENPETLQFSLFVHDDHAEDNENASGSRSGDVCSYPSWMNTQNVQNLTDSPTFS